MQRYHIGRRFARLLASHGLSRRETARRLGNTPQHVDYLVRTPYWSMRTVMRVAKACGFEVEALVGRRASP